MLFDLISIFHEHWINSSAGGKLYFIFSMIYMLFAAVFVCLTYQIYLTLLDTNKGIKRLYGKRR